MLEKFVREHPIAAYLFVISYMVLFMFGFVKYMEPKEVAYSKYVTGPIVHESVQVPKPIVLVPLPEKQVVVQKTKTVTTGFGTYTLTDRDIQCLVVNAYHEARGEGTKGMVAVSMVAVNRALIGHMKSKTVCSAILKPKQFSWTNNKVLVDKWMSSLNKGELKLVQLAIDEFVNGYTITSLSKAIYYHEQNIKPKWSNDNYKVASIKNHIFFNPIPPVIKRA